MSSGGLNGREGSALFVLGAHGPVVDFWTFFIDAKRKAEYSNGLEKGISTAADMN